MTSEIGLAFAHPEERAAATAPGHDPLDRISLRNHDVQVEIGAFQQERGTTQTVRFNVVVEVQPLEGPIDDDVDRILSYDRITEAIAAGLAQERLNLLETLAERVADLILLEPQAQRAFVRIEKLDRGPGALGVEIVRSATQHEDAQVDTPQPVVAFLANAAIEAPQLQRHLDELEMADAPVILCVGQPDGPRLKTGHAMTQRRIDLLSIEQNAWRLAARDDRCVVVGTRTELDWAMRHGKMTVWAPSKMVLDAVDGPQVNAEDGLGLALWFAGEMQAKELVCVGCPAPGSAGMHIKEMDLP